MGETKIVFTPEDKQKLIENRKMIFDWILDNIIAELNEDDVITVDYGGTYMGMRSYETTSNYHLAVYGKKSVVHTNEERKEGFIGVGEKYGGISDFLDDSESSHAIYPVVDNWKEIKKSLMEQVTERRKKKKAIYEFVV